MPDIKIQSIFNQDKDSNEEIFTLKVFSQFNLKQNLKKS